MRFFTIILLFFIASCTHQSGGPEIPAYIYLKNNNFVISNFSVGSNDETELFSGYVFSFKNNNKVDVIGNGQSLSGSWNVFSKSLKEQFYSYTVLKLNLNTSDTQLKKLNSEFEITLSSPNELGMKTNTKFLLFSLID